jgi:hypothetical protein
MKLPPDKYIAGTSLSVGRFWQWAYSDILSNRNRAIFAEFLVGAALDVLGDVRVEWDAVDLHYEGKRIEVKTAAFVQSWAQSRPSKIVFDIGEKLAWDASTNTYATDRGRSADCYVFCLFTEIDPAKARESILNVDHWQFYVLPTEYINRKFAKTRGVALNRIRSACEPVSFKQLKQRVDLVLFETGT